MIELFGEVIKISAETSNPYCQKSHGFTYPNLITSKIIQRKERMELLLANPRGFCAGVERAIGTVEALLESSSAPVHVRHEIVHNRRVVERLSARGAVFVERTEDIPEGALTVLSAHGVAPSVVEAALQRNLELVDATCPLVTKVHLEVARQARAGRSVVIIGHRGHVEVEGLVGHFPERSSGIVAVIEHEGEIADFQPPDPDAVAWVTQTTLAVDDATRIVVQLRKRFPKLIDPRGDTICYATQNRQAAVRTIAPNCDLLLVVGAPHSSNSNRLVEVARESGTIGLLIEGADDLKSAMFAGVSRVGLTASASAPEDVVTAVIDRLRHYDPTLRVTSIGKPEDVHFKLPHSIRQRPKEIIDMTEANASKVEDATALRKRNASASLSEALDAAADLAARLRETAEDVADFAGDQVDRVVRTAEELRDRNLNPKALDAARARPGLSRIRKSSHSVLDVGFDLAAVALNAGIDGLDLVLRSNQPVGRHA
jgi:4-hydroxy-3-methylbut-2-en-1-yl diphosphate reductase